MIMPGGVARCWEYEYSLKGWRITRKIRDERCCLVISFNGSCSHVVLYKEYEYPLEEGIEDNTKIRWTTLPCWLDGSLVMLPGIRIMNIL